MCRTHPRCPSWSVKSVTRRIVRIPFLPSSEAFSRRRLEYETFFTKRAVRIVYGSIARSEEKASSDVDLLVAGETSFFDVVSTLVKIEAEAGREVNPTVYSPREFREKLAATTGSSRMRASKQEIANLLGIVARNLKCNQAKKASSSYYILTIVIPMSYHKSAQISSTALEAT